MKHNIMNIKFLHSTKSTLRGTGPFSAVCLCLALTIGSCTDRFEKLNTNPNQVTSGQMEAKNYRTGTKVLALQSLVVPVEEHQYQFI